MVHYFLRHGGMLVTTEAMIADAPQSGASPMPSAGGMDY
jgi:hypothetical protein